MSNQKQDVLAEKKETVAISGEDIKHIVDFFTHFNIQMPASLKTACEAFAANGGQTIENQMRVKVELASAMYTIDHPIFKDELFSKVIQNSERIVFDAKFQQQLEGELTQQNQG